MRKLKTSLYALLFIASSTVSAQNNVLTVEEDSGRVETIDLPEGMLISEEELNEDYNNKNNLTPGIGIAHDLSATDSLIISRLSRIPTTIEMPLNDVTRKFIEKYISMRGSVSTMLGASNFYFPIFEEALERYGLPLELRYLPVIESALRPSATSRVGAAGLWQFMIATGKRYGLEINTLVDERRDPYKASEAAAHYLSDLYAMFNDWGLAIAAYNCGEGNVQKALLRSKVQEGADYWKVYNKLPHETRGYVPAFIAANYIMNYYCDHGIVPKDATLPLTADTVVVRRELSFSQIANNCSLSIEELRSLNPQYRKDIIPSGYTLCIPSEKVDDYIIYEDSICSASGQDPISISDVRRAVTEDLTDAASSEGTSRSSGRSSRSSRRNRGNSAVTVSVKSGDNLGAIARRNHTTVANIKRLNGLKGDNIRAGAKLRVK